MLFETRKKINRFALVKTITVNVKGQAVKISIPDTGEVVNLFFTNDHADHWFSHAPSAADAVDFE